MRISTKSILAVSATLVVLVVVMSLTLGRVMMTGFKKVENEDTRKNVTRVMDAVDTQLQGIESSLFTWTQWDSAYRFMADKNPEFVKENISSTVYTGMRINFYLFIDPSGAVLTAGGYDILGKRNLTVPEDLLTLLRPGSVLLRNTNPNRSVRGLMNLKEVSLLIVAAPVTDTAGTAPARGHIVFARILDDAVIRILAETTHVGIGVSRTVKAEEGIRVVLLDDETIQGITALKDLDGKPALELIVSTPRVIYQQAIRSLWLLIASILGIGCVFGTVILVIIRFLILRRVLYMSHIVGGMNESLDFSKRLEVQGNDEISVLMTSINGMACAVSEVLTELKRVG